MPTVYGVYFGILLVCSIYIAASRISLLSPLTFFLMFSVLYSTFTFLVFEGYYPSNLGILSLLQDENLIKIHLLNVSISIFGFFLFFCYFRKKHYPKINFNEKNINTVEYKLFIFSFLIGVIVLVLGHVYPWGGWGGEYGRPELINSLITNLKLFYILVIAYFFAKYGFNRIVRWMFLLLFLITVFEGARTILITTVIGALIFGAQFKIFKVNYKLLFFLFIFIISASIIAIIRLGGSVADINIESILYPIYFEGIYGSYMCLQLYQLLEIDKLLPYTYGYQYFYDPLLFLIPRVVFEFFDTSKDALSYYNQFSINANEYLGDNLGPYGGFYFIADAFLSFSYFGTFMISSIFGYITAKLENLSYINFKYRYYYLVYLVSFFIIFMKHQISQSSHFLIVAFFFATIILLITKSFAKSSPRLLGA